MSSSLDIYPFHDAEGLVRFCIQICIFLAGLIIANNLIIKPAMRLHNERKKRTTGIIGLAHHATEKAHELEHEYLNQLKEGTEEAKKLRAKKIQEAQETANQIIAESQKKAALHLRNIENNLSVDIATTKKHLTEQVENIILEIQRKIGFTTLIAIFSLGLFYICPAFAQEENLVESFWYSIFWPYFQFACFLIAAVYFGKKPLLNMLEKRRDELKLRLSEAKEAMTLAERNVEDYKEKIAMLEKEIKDLKEQNMLDAKIEGQKILTEASKVSESILRDAERAGRELITRSREEMQSELFKLALAEVEKRLTPEKLTALDLKFKGETLDVIRAIN